MPVWRKCAANGQGIIAAYRSRSYISPPSLALAPFIHKKYGSRELIDILNSLVLAESYIELAKLVNAQMKELFSQTQWKALCNLSSTMLMSTLLLQQGMQLSMWWVVISVTTPNFQTESVPLQHLVAAASVVGSYNKILLKYYKKRATLGLKSVVFEPLTLLFLKLFVSWI